MLPLGSLRSKYTQIATAGIVGLATLGIVVFVSIQASPRHLAAVERAIAEGVVGEGKVLTQKGLEESELWVKRAVAQRGMRCEECQSECMSRPLIAASALVSSSGPWV